MISPDRTDAPARWFGNIAGTAYLALGMVGFAMTGLTDFTSPHGTRLLLLEVNPLHNLLHVLLGIALMGAASHSVDAASTLALATAAALGAAGLLGVALTGWRTPLALNTADNVTHLATAVIAAGAWHAQRHTTTGAADVGQ